MFILFATIKIKPGFVDSFLKACYPDGQGSLHHEPGCLRFDVLQDRTDPNTIYLCEGYVDEAAFNYHNTTPHFHKWYETTKDMMVSPPSVVFTNSVFPEAPVWAAVKNTLTTHVAESEN